MTKDPNDTPKADSTQWYKCDACENLHMLLLDEDGEPIATAVISRHMLQHMFKVIDDDPTVLIQ